MVYRFEASKEETDLFSQKASSYKALRSNVGICGNLEKVKDRQIKGM